MSDVRAVLAFTLMLCTLQANIMVSNNYLERVDLLYGLHNQGIRFSGQVVSSEPATRGGYRTTVVTSQVTHHTQTYKFSVNLHTYTNQLFIPGSSVAGVGTFQTQGSYYSLKGYLRSTDSAPAVPAIFALKNELRKVAIARIGPDNAGLVLGMAYGDDTPLTEQALMALKVSGLTHLTAVSGSNITLIFVLAYRLAQSLGLPRLVLIATGLCAAGIYVSLVGPDGSVLRAWTMGLLGAIGLVLGHGTYRITLLASCLIGLLFISPGLAADYGFALSVTATASLLILAPALSRVLCRVLPILFADFIALPVAASLWCAPLILLLSESIYPYTVIANIVVAPLVAPITLAGLGALITASLKCPNSVTGFFLDCGTWASEAVHWLSRWCYSLPGSQIPVVASSASLLLTTLIVVVTSALVLQADVYLQRHKYQRLPHLIATGEDS